MNIEHHRWYSHRVGKHMDVVRYGHWGPPMIYYPTSGGGAGEFDYYGMHRDAKWFIDNGKVQFFCIDGFNNESFYNFHIHPADRMRSHMAYEAFVLEEVIPLVLDLSKNDFIGCMGCSFGAYHAMNSVLKYPEIFKLSLSMGGVFDISPYMEGYYDLNVYFNNPVDYTPQMWDPNILDRFHHDNHIILMSGASDKFLYGTERMHDVLMQKGIPHHYEIWPHPCDHHEFWWKKQLPYILGQYYMDF
ncbi:MAG: alpha/beta hydrolase-fold protein [Vulcanimicrobiota bacterium]